MFFIKILPVFASEFKDSIKRDVENTGIISDYTDNSNLYRDNRREITIPDIYLVPPLSTYGTYNSINSDTSAQYDTPAQEETNNTNFYKVVSTENKKVYCTKYRLKFFCICFSAMAACASVNCCICLFGSDESLSCGKRCLTTWLPVQKDCCGDVFDKYDSLPYQWASTAITAVFGGATIGTLLPCVSCPGKKL